MIGKWTLSRMSDASWNGVAFFSATIVHEKAAALRGFFLPEAQPLFRQRVGNHIIAAIRRLTRTAHRQQNVLPAGFR